MSPQPTLSCLFSCLCFCGALPAQDLPEKMPREDVVDVPAIGEGLCVSNVFQTNMVLQRDKPVTIWGWAAPGEKVTVSFAGQRPGPPPAPTGPGRSTLGAMAADATPAGDDGHGQRAAR